MGLCSAQAQLDSMRCIAEETFRLSQAGEFEELWWIPTDFWSHHLPDSLSGLSKDTLLESIDQYLVFAAERIKPASWVPSEWTLDTGWQPASSLLMMDQLDPISSYLLELMRPMVANAFSCPSSAVEFKIFLRSNNPSSQSQVNINQAGLLQLQLEDERFSWVLPLSCFIESKICPQDAAVLSGSWMYCPYHGVLLEKKSPDQ
jgi:hypothetical protein